MTKTEKQLVNEAYAAKYSRRDRKARKKRRAQRVAQRDAVWLDVMAIS